MNKAELIERIIESFTDMGSEAPEDTAVCNELTIDDATTYLNELRENEKQFLDPEDWLPEEITPEIYLEAENCYIRKCKYDVTLDRLTEFIVSHELVDLYHEFDGRYTSSTDKIVYPTDYLTESMEFPFAPYDLPMLDLICIGQNSPNFDRTKDFCWYDPVNDQLHSTDTPFADKLIDARSFAAWILEHPGRIQYTQDWCMINTDIDYIFRYWR